MTSNLRSIRACGAAGLFLSVVFLGGCAALPSTPETALPARDALSDFSLAGRFSLRNEDKSYSGRVSWRHSGVNNEVLLSSPFGQGLAEISTSEEGARLTTSDGTVYVASDAETLTNQVLGYPLPLARLTDWVRGRGTAYGYAERDALGRLLRLRHEDWRVEYAYDGDDARSLPSRLFVERTGGLELRLRIDEWTALPEGTSGK